MKVLELMEYLKDKDPDHLVYVETPEAVHYIRAVTEDRIGINIVCDGVEDTD